MKRMLMIAAGCLSLFALNIQSAEARHWRGKRCVTKCGRVCRTTRVRRCYTRLRMRRRCRTRRIWHTRCRINYRGFRVCRKRLIKRVRCRRRPVRVRVCRSVPRTRCFRRCRRVCRSVRRPCRARRARRARIIRHLRHCSSLKRSSRIYKRRYRRTHNGYYLRKSIRLHSRYISCKSRFVRKFGRSRYRHL